MNSDDNVTFIILQQEVSSSRSQRELPKLF